MSTILHAAVDVEVLEKAPTVPKLGKQGNKLPDAPADHEIRAMLTHARGWLRGAIALAAFAGLRVGEVLALEVGDVELNSREAAVVGIETGSGASAVTSVAAPIGRVCVRRALSEREVLPPKSGHEREVPLAPELRALLVPLLKDKLPHARVVLNREGRTPRRQHVLTALKNLLRRFGLRQRSFHSLRHYFCSKLVSGGASVEAVRLLAGHSDIAITQRYVHALGHDFEPAIAKLSGQ
jgi:integrase